MSSLFSNVRQVAGSAIAALPSLAFALLLVAGLARPAGAVELVMVEQAGCVYCERWHAEIGPAYPNTAEGAFAPLRQEQLRAIPDGITLARRVVFTPTFVLIDDSGTELGRIEGYPGDEFFWFILATLLTEKAGFDPTQTAQKEITQ